MFSRPLNVLAVIPARGGSKGIPRKNLVEFRGKPLIQHTLDVAAASRSVTQVLISTDDDEIYDYCLAQGFVMPYRRPSELGQDTTPMIDVVLDALTWFEADTGTSPDYVLLLQPTSPMRAVEDVDGLIEWLSLNGGESVASVHQVREHPMECVRMQADGTWNYLVEPPPSAYGRQEYPDDFYFINGAMYAATPDFLRRSRQFVGSGPTTAFYPMHRTRGLDIDYPSDLVSFQ